MYDEPQQSPSTATPQDMRQKKQQQKGTGPQKQTNNQTTKANSINIDRRSHILINKKIKHNVLEENTDQPF